MYNTFKDKETRLQNAINKVRAKLESFHTLPPTDPQLNKWNDWHDLEDRLNDRLIDNWKAYKTWHWETYNFNTY